jgi:cobalt/nickel transport system permease protein
MCIRDRSIDPRIKIVSALAILIMVLSYKGYIFHGIVLLTGASLCVWMRMPLKMLITRLSEPLFIVIILIILKTILSVSLASDISGNTFSLDANANTKIFLISIAGLSIKGSIAGLIESLLMSARIIGAITVVGVMGFSMSFDEFTKGLAWLMVPKSMIDVLGFMYRYVFTLIEDAQVIYLAQKNRLGYATAVGSLRSFGALSGSLTIKAFDQSQTITTAMIQRGYDGTTYQGLQKPFRMVEITVSLCLILALGVLWKII